MDDARSEDAGPGPEDSFPTRREVHRRRGRRGPWRRRIVIGLVAVLAIAGAGVGWAAWAAYKLDSNITKVDVSDAIGTDRPTVAPQAKEAVNLLLVGSDNRVGAGNDTYGKVTADPGQHSDTNLLVHLSADRSWATVVSIPRDSMTPAPPKCSKTAPKSEWVMKQWNWNYRDGGAGCLIRTLEGNTGVLIDHYAVVDFRGFKAMVDALDGVEICTDEPINDSHTHLDLSPGKHTLNGEQALAYVRTRKSLGDGSDLGRIKRQQAFLSSVAQEATSSKLLFQPTHLYDFLDAATKSLTTDPGFGLGTMKDLAESLRGIGLRNIQFITVPNETYPADPNRVQWQDSAKLIWQSIREDQPVNEKPKATPTPSASPLTVSPADITVQVLNGSGASGLASQDAKVLEVQGFTVKAVGNATDAAAGTLVEYTKGDEEAARTVAAAFPGARLEAASGLGSTVRVTLGAGAKNPVAVENRTGTAPLPKATVTAPAPQPSATPTLETRPASQSICKTT